MKRLIYTIGLLAGSTLFGWIGALFDHGNWLGGWSILLGTIGAIPGIWLAYKINRSLF